MSPAVLTLPDGRALSYETYGDSDGTPLLFQHGTPGSAVLGSLFADNAAEAGVRIVAPSRPGSGDSDPAPDTGYGDWPADAVALLDHLEIDRAAVAGFSGGCPFAVHLAAARPERVRGLTLVGGPVPGTEQDPLGPLTGYPRLLDLAFRGLGWVSSHRGPGVVTGNLTDRELESAVATTVARDFRRAVGGGASGPVRESGLLAGDWTLPAVEVPTTVSHGRNDENVPFGPVRSYWSGREPVTIRDREADHLGCLLDERPSLVALE